jgi:transaldolase
MELLQPSLMARGNYRKNSILKHYVDICNLVDGDVSAEVNALDYDGMIKEGEELIYMSRLLKLPMTKEGVMAAKYFSNKGVKTNALVFSAGQAISCQSRRYLC